MKFTQPKEQQRAEILQRQQRLKMARSAQAYLRGSPVKFYEWLKTANGKVPKGPPVWICGDCHVGNLGPVSDAEGRVEIEIRDLDQTVIGNPAHDLIRLALSLSMAARSSDLPGVTTALMLGQMMIGYCDALKPEKAKPKPTKGSGKPIRIVGEMDFRAETGTFAHALREHMHFEIAVVALKSSTRFLAIASSVVKNRWFSLFRTVDLEFLGIRAVICLQATLGRGRRSRLRRLSNNSHASLPVAPRFSPSLNWNNRRRPC